MYTTFRFGRQPLIAAFMSLATTAPAMADYTLKTLVKFNGTNGATPSGGLVADAGGNLYGTTYNGGADGGGIVFKIPAGTSNVSTFASFNGTDGARPFSGVAVDSSGNLYGSTSVGGADGDGAVYEIPSGTNTINLLASFDGSNGRNPVGGVIVDSSGNVYGTTENGAFGEGSAGTVFEVVKGSGAPTTLHAFSNQSGGEVWAGLRSDASDNLYGATIGGGTDGDGTVFEIPSGTTNVVTVASFTGDASGTAPWSTPVFDSAGNLYGTTLLGDPASPRQGGAVYEIVKGSSVPIARGQFAPPNGLVPGGDLAIDAAGDIFGTTEAGGAFDNVNTNNLVPGDGTVFEIPAGTDTVTTLLSFDGADGAGPVGGIYLDAAGDLYGTTEFGGVNNDGTVFELSPVVPEPGSLAMLAVTGALGLRRKAWRRCGPGRV
jgi:uncharacterized repeat protein (TIGR03803 family)